MIFELGTTIWLLEENGESKEETTGRTGSQRRTDVRSELPFSMEIATATAATAEGIRGSQDYISQLPDDCLVSILNFLSSGDRKSLSLASKKMLKVEGHGRRRLTLNAAGTDHLPALLSRFDSATELVIRCHRSSAVDVDDTVILIGKHSGNRFKDLILVGVNVSSIGIESVARNFKQLERLTLCGGEKSNIGDEEISCVAAKCVGLKKVRIKRCAVTDQGIKAFASAGCPGLLEIDVDECGGVTSEVVGWVGARRRSVVVKLDAGGGLESDSDSDDGDGGGRGGVQENGVPIPVPARLVSPQASNGEAWPPSFRSRFGVFRGKNLISGGFRNF